MTSWALSTVDMEFLVDALSLPPLPYPLGAPTEDTAFDERAALVEAVRADLAHRGFSSRGTLGDALVLLAFGEFVIDGRLRTDPEVDLAGAVRDDHAALAVRTGDTVRVELVPDAALTDLVVDLLPVVPQLPGDADTVPYEALSTALAAIPAPRDGGTARFGVAGRTPATGAYRNRRVWTWHASPAGGVLLTHDPADAPEWTTVVPAGPARVGRYLADALHGLRFGGGDDVRGE